MKNLEDLAVGDKLLIRRTNGQEQKATVHQWLCSKSSLGYQAPEVVIMQVTFECEDQKLYKCIAGMDFIRAEA